MKKKVEPLLRELIERCNFVRLCTTSLEITKGTETVVFNTGPHNTLEDAMVDAINWCYDKSYEEE